VAFFDPPMLKDEGARDVGYSKIAIEIKKIVEMSFGGVKVMDGGVANHEIAAIERDGRGGTS